MEMTWLDRVFGCLLVVVVAVLVVVLCLMPPRYSDGRLVEEVAREMYDAGLDDGGDW